MDAKPKLYNLYIGLFKKSLRFFHLILRCVYLIYVMNINQWYIGHFVRCLLPSPGQLHNHPCSHPSLRETYLGAVWWGLQKQTFYHSRSFARSERDGNLMVQGLGYTVDVVTHSNHVATIFAEWPNLCVVSYCRGEIPHPYDWLARDFLCDDIT